MLSFNLSKDFVKKYRNKKAPFGFNGLGELTYFRTYSRLKEDGKNEQWYETVERVVNGTYSIQKDWVEQNGLGWNQHKAQKSAQEMYDRIFHMKFLPPGRGLWAMGSAVVHERGLFASLNNCFAYETEIITKNGIKPIGELAGTTQTLLSKNGKWVESKIKSFGKQDLVKLTISRQGMSKDIYTTANHQWFAKSQSEVSHSKGYSLYETKDLKSGYRLQYCFGQGIADIIPSTFGIAHGIGFGDGNEGHIYLCGHKDKELLKYFNNSPSSYDSNKCSEGAIRVSHLPKFFKDRPSLSESKSYLLGWLMGYFSADGSCDEHGQIKIASSIRENIVFYRDVCSIIGIGTYSIREETRKSNLTNEDFTMYSMILMPSTLKAEFFLISKHRDNFIQDRVKRNWNVVSINNTDRNEEVYCATVPDLESFTLADNILTHNCAFTSTAYMKDDPITPFTFMMDASMLGVGVGFDTKGAGTIVIKGPSKKREAETIIIPDSREGWSESLKYTLETYFLGIRDVSFDYSLIRPAGEPIKGFGGIAPGPEPLKEMHTSLKGILDKCIGQPITERNIVDIQNVIGKAVVSGGVRRTAQISFGSYDCDEYLDLKNYKVNPEREPYGWTSNNSIFANIGMNYGNVADRTKINGEPGYFWIKNAQMFSRMNGIVDNKDHRAIGANPCNEQTLEHMELCCLVESFPANHDSLQDYLRTLKFAYLYAKTVTLGKTHWPETNRVLLRNRRIGCSMSGIAQFITKHGIDNLKEWCEEGYDTIQEYDEEYSNWLAIPRSIKTTSIKPSGTVSLLAGATPGIHYPESRFYIRRMRLAKHSELVPFLKKAGYHIEPCVGNEDSTVVVEVPVDVGQGIKTLSEVSMWEQLSLAAFMQKYWADNQVSCTVTFDSATEGKQIESALNFYQYQLKGISLLPRLKHGAYAQMPYEEIDEESYKKMAHKLKPLSFKDIHNEEVEVDKFCNNDICEVKI